MATSAAHVHSRTISLVARSIEVDVISRYRVAARPPTVERNDSISGGCRDDRLEGLSVARPASLRPACHPAWPGASSAGPFESGAAVPWGATDKGFTRDSRGRDSGDCQ